MSKQPVPWAIALVSILYFGMLVYWQSEALFGDTTLYDTDAAVFGLGLSVAYVAYLMFGFLKDLPPALKDLPVIGKFGKLLGWLAFVGVAVWYVRPGGEHVDCRIPTCWSDFTRVRLHSSIGLSHVQRRQKQSIVCASQICGCVSLDYQTRSSRSFQ